MCAFQSIISYDELTINLAGDTVTNQFNDCYNELCDFFAHLPSNAIGHSNSEVRSFLYFKDFYCTC